MTAQQQIETIYIIEQSGTDTANWEPIPEGEFSSLAEAEHAMHELESDLGWTGMRIVHCERDEDGIEVLGVVATGRPHPADCA